MISVVLVDFLMTGSNTQGVKGLGDGNLFHLHGTIARYEGAFSRLVRILPWNALFMTGRFTEIRRVPGAFSLEMDVGST